MTSIDPSQRLAAAVRQQLTSLRERGTGRSERSAPAALAPRGRHAVSSATAQRIEAIAPDDPDRPRKAVRIYLEAELAREFGARLLNDPAFPAMLDAVQQRMQEDEQMATAVDALGQLLASGKLRAA